MAIRKSLTLLNPSEAEESPTDHSGQGQESGGSGWTIEWQDILVNAQKNQLILVCEDGEENTRVHR